MLSAASGLILRPPSDTSMSRNPGSRCSVRARTVTPSPSTVTLMAFSTRMVKMRRRLFRSA